MSCLDLIGAPCGSGAGESGCQFAPEELRNAGLLEALRDLGHLAIDQGNVQCGLGTGFFSRQQIAGAWCRSISASVEASLRCGSIPILLGGDHSLSAGSIDGALRFCGRPVVVLWIDAHADCNTPRTSPTGNPHGMPVAALMGEPGFADWFPDEHRPLLNPRNTYLFGLRSCDPSEHRLLTERGVRVFDSLDVEAQGVAPLIREVLDRVRLLDAHLHVSFDVDVLDPSIMAGVGTPVPGGLTFREAQVLMRILASSGRVNSVDVVELNPTFDPTGASRRLAVDLVATLFGRRYHSTPRS